MPEWATKRLDEAAEVIMGSSPPGHTYNETGDGLPFIQGSAEFGTHIPSPVKWCSAPVKVAEPGDLLVSVRAPVGDTNFADQRIAIGRGLAIVRGGSESSSTFLRLALQHAADELLARSGSGMFSSITAKELKGFEIPLPPLAEQRRIVDVMAAVDAQIEALEAESEWLSAVAVMARASAFESVASADTSPAGDIFDMLLGRQKSAKQSVGDHVHPYLRAANIASGRLMLDDVQAMNFEPKEQEKYGLLDGDIVLVEGGSLGQAARWTSPIPGMVGFDKHVIRLRERPNRSLAEYALQWCHWARETGAFDDQATGITIKALGFGRASSMPVPNLSLADQHDLVAPLAAADSLYEATLVNLRALRAFRSTALSALLSQQIEIPESYDALLDNAVEASA